MSVQRDIAKKSALLKAESKSKRMVAVFGTVMFLVTDGRTSRSLGATRNDIIDVLREYGAVTAGMLDGGSSAMLWYRDWFDKYPADKSLLDTWQKVGLVNIFKAFTNPRAIPSYFIVK